MIIRCTMYLFIYRFVSILLPLDIPPPAPPPLLSDISSGTCAYMKLSLPNVWLGHNVWLCSGREDCMEQRRVMQDPQGGHVVWLCETAMQSEAVWLCLWPKRLKELAAGAGGLLPCFSLLQKLTIPWEKVSIHCYDNTSKDLCCLSLGKHLISDMASCRPSLLILIKSNIHSYGEMIKLKLIQIGMSNGNKQYFRF